MGKPILLLRLEGPLQSWGARSRWSRRDTGLEPTKSAIIGMLGCAAGILRPDWHSDEKPDRTLEQWDKALRFGVRIDRPGVVETDYHTVQGQHWQADGKMKTASSASGARREKALLEPPHTEVTWRDYLHDAAFLVALESRNPDLGVGLLASLKCHLESPKWPLCLGRKSCLPSCPVFDRLTDKYACIESALKAEPWAAPRSYSQNRRRTGAGPPPEMTSWIESTGGDYERPDALRVNQLRFYEFRRCCRLPISSKELAWRIY